MKKTLLSVVTVLFFAASALLVTHSFAGGDSAKHEVVKADAVEWVDAGKILPAGAQLSVIEGDLADEEVSVARLKFPADYEVPAHTHPSVERVTVLSGTVHFGTGEKLDKEKTTELSAGSFFKVDAKHPHYVWTGEGQETVLEIVTDGVFGIEYVNPKDDPRITTPVGGGPDEDTETPNKSKE